MFGSILAGLVLLITLNGCGDRAADHVKQGAAHFQKQEYDLAIQCYEKAIKLEPKSAVAYNLLGLAYRCKYNQWHNPEMRAKEVEAFQKAMAADPQYWVAMINLGATYYFQGETAKAAPLFKQALTLNPHHPEKARLEKMIAAGAGRE